MPSPDDSGAVNSSGVIEQRVNDLPGRMTLEEKIAQMSVLDRIAEGITGDYDLERLRETFQWK